MLTLTIRTDKPLAEIGIYDGEKELKQEQWQAHRKLAESIHKKIDELLQSRGKKLRQVQRIVVFKGPGSFTGLRIGITVANTLADSLAVPIVSEHGEDWIRNGIERLDRGDNETIAVPEYGAAPNVTRPKH